MEKTVFVTGLTGFVGPYLARRLVDLGYEVHGLARRRADGTRPRRLHDMNLLGKTRLFEGDVTDLTSLISALDKSRPEVIFHLAAQSFVPRSFSDPLETYRINTLGTANLLEAVRLRDLDSRVVFAGSSEEYGLQIASQDHYRRALKQYGVVIPEPKRIPELPVSEDGYLRPMSPYAVTKVHGDFLMTNYYHAYGLKTLVSRAFNHEGAGRGRDFVTSTVVRQCVSLRFGEIDKILIGNVNVFRDWSHVEDIVNGYVLLSEKGKPGEVYVQGSMRTNSVLTYILLTLQHIGYQVEGISTSNGERAVKEPLELRNDTMFNAKFERSKIDELLLKGELEYFQGDGGLDVQTNHGTVKIVFDPDRFRQPDVPILMSDTTKIQNLGFRTERGLEQIIRDQVNYYLNPENRIVKDVG